MGIRKGPAGEGKYYTQKHSDHTKYDRKLDKEELDRELDIERDSIEERLKQEDKSKNT